MACLLVRCSRVDRPALAKSSPSWRLARRSPTADVRQAQLPPDRFVQPAFLLRDRLIEQRRRLPRFALQRDGHHPGGRRVLPPGFHYGHELQEAEEQTQH
jgi:hypothetical protein